MQLLFFLSLFILRERDRDSASGGGAEGEETESQARSMLPMQSSMGGLNSQHLEIVIWAETKSWTLNEPHLGALSMQLLILELWIWAPRWGYSLLKKKKLKKKEIIRKRKYIYGTVLYLMVL